MTMRIIASGLSKRFKQRGLFDIDSLSIGPNEAIYLKGDNGVGKTTLLKILSGLERATTGKIYWPEPKWWHRYFARWGRKHVVYLHQSPYLFDGSVYSNVAYGIRFHSLSRQQKRAQVIQALRMVGLESIANEHICVLSGGEKQRIAMARAWLLQPLVLLMDEPSASLDPESIQRLVVMANDLLSQGASLVITSHHQNALTALCSKQWWIKDGQLFESPLLHVIEQSEDERLYVTTNTN